jgi:hypothetical protein
MAAAMPICHAQEAAPADQLRAMDTDRPNVTNTPHTIDAGHVQLEAGMMDYTYDRDRYQGADARSDRWDFGQLNIRVGVLGNLELNAIVDAYQFVRTRDDAARTTSRAAGIGDTIVGGKLNLWGNSGSDDVWATAFAIQPQIKLPTAHDTIGNGRVEFSVGVPFQINLPAGFHLGLQSRVAYERDTANTGYVIGLENSIAVDHVVFDKLDLYVEYAAAASTEKHVEAVQTMDVGGTYALTDNVVLDTGLNLGLNKASDNVEILAGISVRF